MSIIREKIRLVPGLGTDLITNIKFGLGNNDGFVGYQQEIDNLTQNTSAKLINPPTDVEKIRIGYAKYLGLLKLEFNFHVSNSTTFGPSFEYAGFTNKEITEKTPNILNSFFIMDFYDSHDINTQSKIFTTYLTKISFGETSNGLPISRYEIGGNIVNQLFHWYVPKSYLNGITLNGFIKFSFYNAKTGKIIPFYNYDNESLISSQKMFFNAAISVTYNTWNISTPAAHSRLVIARELWNSPEYVEKVDNTLETINNKAQNYPNGNAFNYTTGKYNTI